MISSLRLPLLALLLSAGAQMLNAQEPPRSELQALSYYHQQGDRAATEAEMRRLRLKYPQWMPPADLSKLSVTAPSQEIDLYYRQIAAGDYEGARSTLAQAKAAFPDWQPPAEMTALLALSEGQKRFDEALSAGDPRRAADLAGRIPDLLRCERINNAWRLAETQTATGRKTQALGLYQSILETCANSADLSATLEKADQIADEAQMSRLFDIAFRRFPAEAPRFEALQTRLLAGRGKAAPPAKAAPAPVGPGPAAAGARPGAPARSPAVAGGSTGGGARNVQAAKDRGDWAGCLAASEGSANTAAQYNRAWCAYNLDRPLEAVDSFRRALQGRMTATERRDAQYGIALAYLKMGMTEPAAQIAARVDLTRSQRVDVERQILDQRGVAAYNARNYVQAIRYFDALEQISGGISRNLGMLRAWSYLNSGQRARARAEFLRMHNELASTETARGLEAAGE